MADPEVLATAQQVIATMQGEAEPEPVAEEEEYVIPEGTDIDLRNATIERMHRLTDEIASNTHYWSGELDYPFKEEHYTEWMQFMETTDEQMSNRLIVDYMKWFIGHVEPPAAFWDGLAGDLIALSGLKIKSRHRRSFTNAIERLSGHDLDAVDRNSFVTGYDEAAWYLLKNTIAPNRRNMMFTFYLILAIVRQRGETSALVEIEYQMMACIQRKHMLLIVPEPIVNKIMESQRKHHDSLISRAAPIYITHTPAEVDEEELGRQFQDAVLRPAMASEATRGVRDAVLPQPTDPRFM